MAPIPWTVISGVVTVQLTVKLNVLLVLYVNETVPLTGDPAEFARQVRSNVVEAPCPSEVDTKFAAKKSRLGLALGGLVSVNCAAPGFDTVILLTSAVPLGVVPIS